MGITTLIPDNAVNGMNVADVDGVRVAGILFDTGTGDSEALLTIGGTVGSTVSHAGNPTTVQDVYFRIGGGDAIGRAKQSLVVNSNDTIIDHIWGLAGGPRRRRHGRMDHQYGRHRIDRQRQ